MYKNSFKGTVSCDFWHLVFFHQSNPHWCHWYHRSDFSGVNNTAEMAMKIRCAISAVSMTHWWSISVVSLTLWKLFHGCQWHRWNYFSGVIDTSETNFVNYLHEFEAIFQKALTRVSGLRGSCLIKKQR
jgi:hypothetical protein